MKHWLLPCCVLLGLLGAALWNASRVQTHTQRWCAQLEQAQRSALEEDWDAARGALEQVYADWTQRQLWLHIVAVHSWLEDAEATFAAARLHAQAQACGELCADLAALRTQFWLLCAREQLTLGNVL